MILTLLIRVQRKYFNSSNINFSDFFSSMYTSPRKFNRHTFGLGNNLGGNSLNNSKDLVREKYTTIQDTASLKSSLPQKKFSFDQNVRGSLQSNLNGKYRYKDARKTGNQPSLEFSQDLID